jgi:FtsH-binding integral membrane protein
MDDSPQGKKAAIIAYLTFIGLLVAFYMNREDRHEFATWHIKNMFGLVILLFVSMVLQTYEIGFYFYWLSVILWIYSFVMMLFNRKLGIPYFSEKFQQWFTFLN